MIVTDIVNSPSGQGPPCCRHSVGKEQARRSDRTVDTQGWLAE
jgi:hypothetical protein